MNIHVYKFTIKNTTNILQKTASILILTQKKIHVQNKRSEYVGIFLSYLLLLLLYFALSFLRIVILGGKLLSPFIDLTGT